MRHCMPDGNGAADSHGNGAADSQAPAVLNSLGAAPVHRLNARVKALGSENPSRNATSVADVPGRERCSIARFLRTSSTSWRYEVCSSLRLRWMERSLIASSDAISDREGTAPRRRAPSSRRTRPLTPPRAASVSSRRRASPSNTASRVGSAEMNGVCSTCVS